MRTKRHKMSSLRNLKLTLAYDGTRYYGWQIQEGHVTIQGVLEKAIYEITGEGVRVIGSGRTDAGVHALGQVAHFRSQSSLSCKVLKRAINSKLPADIRIVHVQEVDLRFHAQFSAKGKTYRYQIWNGLDYPVLERNTLAIFSCPLNVREMRKAAAFLVGRHDFSSFGVNRGDGSKPLSSVRTMKRVSVSKKGSRITILLEADGFLYKMVRSIVGTLLEVGLGKISASEFGKILRGHNRSLAGRTALASGLCLMRVKY